ncbi:MAG: plasmid pRiA4b ORF-3 family protein [Patescibacteria group bacterium]|nr:plasmid pRiA4b ORF-3 family protein [Patescibacteria group bacterium]
MADASERRLIDFIIEPEDSFVYLYDFGDSWRHDVKLEKVVTSPADGRAACLGGNRACPPEDCGGPPGYARLRRVLGNPAHREYRETRTWVGRAFQPEAFDLEKANRHVGRLRV